MTEQTTAIVPASAMEERKITYVPFQSNESISLTAAMVTKFLCRPTKQGFVCSPEQAFRFMMLCKARSLNPWEGDAYLVGYDTKDGPEFNLITAHQAFLKRAEAHPKFDGMESGIVVADDQDVVVDVPGDFLEVGLRLAGGWARVHRSDRKFPTYRRLNLTAFQKPFGVWITNPQGMIVKCAEADAMRSAFPNSLAGVYMDGEPMQADTPSFTATVSMQSPAANPAAVLANIIDAAPRHELTNVQAQATTAEQSSTATAVTAPTTQAAPMPERRGRKLAAITDPTVADFKVPADQMAADVAAGKQQLPTLVTPGPTPAPAASTAASSAATGTDGGGMFDDIDNLDQLSHEEIDQVKAWKEKAATISIETVSDAIRDRKSSARRKDRLLCKTMTEFLATRGLNPNGTKIQQAPAVSQPAAAVNEVEKVLAPPAESKPIATQAAAQPGRPATEFDIEAPIQWAQFLDQCKEAARIDLSKTITDPVKLEKSINDAVKSTASKFPLRHGWVGKAEEKAVTPAGQADIEKAMDLMLSEGWNWALAKPL